jgi:hypothetical protein
MSFGDALEVGAAVVASLGGGGVIVLSLSGYLGKLWAERALEREKNIYAELLLATKSELDKAASRYQVELDKLGLVHRLRLTEEFTRLGSLWKQMAILQNAFNGAVGRGLRMMPADLDERQKYQDQLRSDYIRTLYEARKYFMEEKLFVPKFIADSAELTLKEARVESDLYDMFANHHDPGVRRAYLEDGPECLEKFNSGMQALESLMREHLDGRVLRQT